jgi:hypothetical protein
MEGSHFVYYVEGLLITLSALLLWFYSPLQVSLAQIFIHKNLYSLDQVNTAIMIKSKFLAKLLGCFICCSFWTSLVVGCFFMLITDVPKYFPLLTWFTYPSICYLYKTIIDRRP